MRQTFHDVMATFASVDATSQYHRDRDDTLGRPIPMFARSLFEIAYPAGWLAPDDPTILGLMPDQLDDLGVCRDLDGARS